MDAINFKTFRFVTSQSLPSENTFETGTVYSSFTTFHVTPRVLVMSFTMTSVAPSSLLRAASFSLIRSTNLLSFDPHFLKSNPASKKIRFNSWYKLNASSASSAPPTLSSTNKHLKTYLTKSGFESAYFSKCFRIAITSNQSEALTPNNTRVNR